jgi:penicillin amidase
VGDDFPFFISHHYDHAYRARRILELIDAGSALTAADVARQQVDQVDLFAQGAKRVAARAALDAGRADLADRLRAWDGTMAADRVEPALFWAWYRHLQRLTYDDESPDYRPAAPLHRWLAAGGSDWFDDGRTPEVETLDVLARQAMDSALAHRLGVWGEAHRTVMQHPLGEVPVLGRVIGFSVGPFPNGGSNHTVNVALSTRMRPPFTSGYGPSMRHVVDLARPDDAGGFIIPTGQSGHPLSRHYRDQLDCGGGEAVDRAGRSGARGGHADARTVTSILIAPPPGRAPSRRGRRRLRSWRAAPGVPTPDGGPAHLGRRRRLLEAVPA